MNLEASNSAAYSGSATCLCSGATNDALVRVARGEAVGTLFLPGKKLGSRKHWLAFTTQPKGVLVLDDGAAKAVRERGRSLLAAGVVEVRGRFGIGDTVSCVDRQGAEVARGLASYGASEVEKLKGRSTREIAAVLGYFNGDAVIHRDDLVVVS